VFRDMFVSCLFIQTKTTTCFFFLFRKLFIKITTLRVSFFLYSATSENNNISFVVFSVSVFCVVAVLCVFFFWEGVKKKAVTSPGAAFSPDLFRESAITGESYFFLSAALSQSYSPTTDRTLYKTHLFSKEENVLK
jgi:hypothetical protein